MEILFLIAIMMTAPLLAIMIYNDLLDIVPIIRGDPPNWDRQIKMARRVQVVATLLLIPLAMLLIVAIYQALTIPA